MVGVDVPEHPNIDEPAFPTVRKGAPAALLGLGVVVNVALLLYITGGLKLFGGELPTRQSVVLVCLAMLAVGLVLYAINGWMQRQESL